MMRTGQTIKNDNLNVMATSGQGQQKGGATSQLQRCATGLKIRSLSPAHRSSPRNILLGGNKKSKMNPDDHTKNSYDINRSRTTA